MKNTIVTQRYLVPLVVVLLAATSVFQAYQLHTLGKIVGGLDASLSSTTATFLQFASSTETRLDYADSKDAELSSLLSNERNRLNRLDDSVYDFDREVGKLSGSVETLEKLTKTDPELLQKYSNVYFLNEHYMPGDLEVIEEKYDLVNGKEVSIHAEVWPFLKDLLRNAWRDDVELLVLSGYRSFAEQTSLKQNYVTQYGVGANQFSADQGYSEHQLGTTVDFTSSEIGEDLALFKDTKEYTWLLENAHEFGFTLSYPEGNSFYTFEPWHWRFVGIDLATYLHRRDKHFYDLDQRDIDTYIADLFED